MEYLHPNKKGFTLIEILLSITFLTIIAGVGFEMFVSFQTRNGLDIALSTIVNSLRRAEIESRGVVGDARHGVHIDTGAVTLFEGDDYAHRLIQYDEILDIDAAVTVSGTTEYVFEKQSGNPIATGSTTLTAIGEERVININEAGTINY